RCRNRRAGQVDGIRPPNPRRGGRLSSSPLHGCNPVRRGVGHKTPVIAGFQLHASPHAPPWSPLRKRESGRRGRVFKATRRSFPFATSTHYSTVYVRGVGGVEWSREAAGATTTRA